MSDIGLIAVMIVAFALAIGLVQLLGRLIDSGGGDDWADEPPDTGGASALSASPDGAAPGGPR
jgi:hypothetical protein